MANRPPKHEITFFVYVLNSRGKNDCRTYVGWTADLKRRLQQHNAGVAAKSSRWRKWVLLYSKCCKTRSEAMSASGTSSMTERFRTTLRGIIRTWRRELAAARRKVALDWC
jgi:predicted GIY-YIG superfamily endonuclease